MTDTGSLQLLATEMRTLWDLDADGRLRGYPPPLELPSPLLVVAGSARGSMVVVSAKVDDELAGAIGSMVAGARGDRIGWEPASAADIVAALDRPVRTRRGPSYLVPAQLGRPSAPVTTSRDVVLDDLRRALPDEDRALRPPFVIAWRGGEVAAVCETARDAGDAVEAGVWTYPHHRRRGLAGAVVRAWAALVSDRHAFYSTSDDNHASIGVARSLGLAPVAHWWVVEPA